MHVLSAELISIDSGWRSRPVSRACILYTKLGNIRTNGDKVVVRLVAYSPQGNGSKIHSDTTCAAMIRPPVFQPRAIGVKSHLRVRETASVTTALANVTCDHMAGTCY